ncbi:MAG TPA: ABC transporter permease [Micromonosporaceae bacterium]
MNAFVGTGALVRLILRRDRVLMPVWILFLSLTPVLLASSIKLAYPTAAGLAQYAAESKNNATFSMLYGQITKPTLGGMTFWRSASGMTFLGLIALLTVVRHTRTEEEAGRRELVGATVVGRQASLAAALITTFAACLAVGVLVGLGLLSQGVPGGGAVIAGLAWTAAGWMFAAVGAVAAQLTEGAGAARGLALSVLGVAFVLRAAGDANNSWLSWLSPLGWTYRADPFGSPRWWVFIAAAAVVAVFGVLAMWLSGQRDLGAGFLPERTGPAEAGPGLRSALGLAWRLQRGALLAWTTAFAVLGLIFGGVAKTTVDLFEKNERLGDVFQRLGGRAGMSDVFIAGMMSVAALIVTGYAVSAALKLRTEEASLRSEPVLATKTGRFTWLSSHLVFAIFGPTLALAVCGLIAGLTYGASVSDVGWELPRVLGAALVQLPAVWLLAGLTVALFGLLPRLAQPLGWTALAVCLFLGQIGALLRLGQALLDVSPFTHVPKVPATDLSAVPLLWLAGIAALLMVAGFVGFRRRDIPVT